jgi:REP element-mobilizing transposase RayT
MARKAREKVPFGTYYITQSCSEHEQIFHDDRDRDTFLSIIEEKKQQFNFRIYGYCLADAMKYKLIIYDAGSDISKIMKSINISLAMKMDRQSKLFKDRFKSILLKDPNELTDIMASIHQHSHCCEYQQATHKGLIDHEVFFTSPDSTRESVMIRDSDSNEFCLRVNPDCKKTGQCIRTYSDGEKAIQMLAKSHDLTLMDFLENKKLRNKELLAFRTMTTLSLKEIGQLFGGLSESAVCKIISRNNKNEVNHNES